MRHYSVCCGESTTSNVGCIAMPVIDQKKYTISGDEEKDGNPICKWISGDHSHLGETWIAGGVNDMTVS
jgi:hypothetical protein